MKRALLKSAAMVGLVAALVAGCKDDKKPAPTPAAAPGAAPAAGSPAAKAPAVTIDQSSPMAAAKTLVAAMRAGDVAAARAVIQGTEKELKDLDTIVPAKAANYRLLAAAQEKWGRDDAALKETFLARSAEPTEAVDDATAKEEGDKATVTSKKIPDRPLKLVKVDGKWKVEHSSLDSMWVPPEGHDQINDEVAANIKANKYASAKDVQNALMQKAQEYSMKKVQAELAASRPTSGPSIPSTLPTTLP